MKTNYFYIEPEVAGGLGPGTIIDRATHPPGIANLNYRFDGWLGDVIVESFPCFMIEENALRELENNGLSGFSAQAAQINFSETYREQNAMQGFPKFLWMKIAGSPGKDDFGIAADLRCVVSSRALDVLQRLHLQNAIVEPYDG